MAQVVKCLPWEKCATINELGTNLAVRNELHFLLAASHGCIACVTPLGPSWILFSFFLVYN
jgi:hypothetical protein